MRERRICRQAALVASLHREQIAEEYKMIEEMTQSNQPQNEDEIEMLTDAEREKLLDGLKANWASINKGEPGRLNGGSAEHRNSMGSHSGGHRWPGGAAGRGGRNAQQGRGNWGSRGRRPTRNAHNFQLKQTLVALVHVCLQPPALTRHTAPPPVAKSMHHVGAGALTNCPQGVGLVMMAWGAMGNSSAGASAFGAREYLTGVELVWNSADALFPQYRHAALLFGGRGSNGAVRSDTWLVPMPQDARSSLLTLSNATQIETLGEQAPARWGHSAVWTGRGADKSETWPSQRSYAGRIEENSDLISAQGHPVQDLRHTISGKLHAKSTIAPCVGGNTRHKHINLDCNSNHGRAGGCSCVRLVVESKTSGVLDRDTVLNDTSASLYPSAWSGRRLEIIAGPGRGYKGFISYNSVNHIYNLAPALDVQLDFGEDTTHFVITEAAMQTPSVPLDTMWVFGGRDAESSLTNDVYALTTSISPHLDGVTAASAVDYQYSPTGFEDFTRSTNGWFYEKSQLVDFGSPLRPTQGPRDPRIVQIGPAKTSVCGEYGSILGGYQLLGPDTVLSKIYKTSAVHTSVQISFDFIKIDFWNGEQVQLFVDGRLVWTRSFFSNPNATVREPQICGRDDPLGFRGETLVPVNVTVPHSHPKVSISLSLYYNGTSTGTRSVSPRSLDSWWGLRRVYVRTLPRGFSWRKVDAKHVGGGAPSPRAHHASAQFRETMFVFGGSTARVVPSLESDVMVFTNHRALNDTKLGDLWAFNTTSETWHALVPSIAEQARDRHGHNATAPIARSHHTFVMGRGDSLFLYGGQSQSGLFISDVHVLQARELRWETAGTLGKGPGARAGHAAVTSAGRMWVYGGYRMDMMSRNVKLQESVHYLDLSDLTWHDVSGPALPGPVRYGSVLVNGPANTFAVLGGATSTPRAGLPGVFPSGSPTAPAMDISLLSDAYVAQLACAPPDPKDPVLHHRAQLVCNSMGEIDWLRNETAKLQTSMSAEIFDLEKRLTAAYLAAAVRRDQYGTDKEWLDSEVTKYTDLVATLVREGKVYTDQMSTLAQARRNRVEMEINYVLYAQKLEGRKLALHMQVDETRQRYEKSLERLELREAVITRRKAEGALSAGTQHSCAINAQDRAQCWGLNDIHQSDPPRDVALRGIAAGDHHSCGIRSSDSRIVCWGANSFGKSQPPASIANKAFSEISAGGGHVCGVQTSGEISCFGDNREGQTMAPSLVVGSNAVGSDAANGQFVMVSAGYAHTCALRALTGADVARRQGRIECWGKPADARTKPPTGTFKWVTAGGKHSCAIDLQGRVYCWGSNSHSQIAAPRSTFSTVTAGHLHTCGIRSNGDAECWGSNVFGQSTVPPKRRWQAVSAGYEHTCGVDALRHQVVCWGKMVPTPNVPTCARVWVQ